MSFYGGLVRDTNILVDAPSEKQKDFLAPDFYLNSFFFVFFFYSVKGYRYNLVKSNTAVQSPFFFFSFFFFFVEKLYLSKTWYLKGKASQLPVLTFNNSLITRLAALKYGSTREMEISVTLNSVRQTTANVCVLR